MKLKSYLIILAAILLVVLLCGFLLWALTGVLKNFTLFSPVEIDNLNETFSTEDFITTNQSNGSFNIRYIRKLYYYGRIKESANCTIIYPSGWVVSSDEEYKRYQAKRHGVSSDEEYKKFEKILENGDPKEIRIYRLIYKESLWNTSLPEYISYFLLPPETFTGSNLRDKYEMYLEMKNNNETINEEIIENVLYKRNNDGSNFVDVITVDESSGEKEIVHEITYIHPSKFGATITYWAPYGKDQDIYSIMDSITCEGIAKWG